MATATVRVSKAAWRTLKDLSRQRGETMQEVLTGRWRNTGASSSWRRPTGPSRKLERIPKHGRRSLQSERLGR